MATKKSSKTASKLVKKHMHEFKHGEKMAGGRKIKNPKQAIAIGLSEARKAGANVPPPPAKKKATKKAAAKKSTANTSVAKKTATKKATGRKTAIKRTAAKKATKKAATKKR